MALTAQEIRQRDLRYKKQNYEWAKARGLCVRCMKERAAPGRYKCLECLSISVELNNACNAKLSQDEKEKREERNRESMKTLYAQRKAAGLCTACGKPAYKGQAFCNECRLRRNRQHRERYIRKPAGECRYCERPALPGRQMCKEHYERDLEILEYARSQRKTDPVRDAINDFWKLKKAGG